MTEQTNEPALMDDQTWNNFCDQLKNAGQVILRDKSPNSELDRAEGWRYLTRLTRLAFEQYLEHHDSCAPTLYRLSHETAKIGCDNPDAYYQNAMIDGRFQYRISGTRGTVQYLGLGTYSGGYGQDNVIEPTGYIDGRELEVNEDGSLEIILSTEAVKKGNWLPMKQHTALLVIRQFRQDWENDEIAELKIERIGLPNIPEPLSADKLVRGLTASAKFVEATAAIFADWSESFMETPNTLIFKPIEEGTGLGDPNNLFWHGYWNIGANQALIIEAMPPECETWNFQLNNYWEESLDFRFHNVTINKHSAKYEADGSVKIVISHCDPGFGNWMETVGHTNGTMGLRWTGASHQVEPQARIVTVDDRINF